MMSSIDDWNAIALLLRRAGLSC